MAEIVRTRIAIVAGCYADAEPAIGLALRLAPELQGNLVGVLARDPLALAAAGSAVLAGRHQTGALSTEALRSAYDSDARAFSARLSRLARATSLAVEFRSTEGHVAQLACELRTGGHIVLVGYRRMMRLRGPVLLVGDGAGSRAAGFAARLARALGVRTETLAETDIATIDRTSASALVLAAESQLAAEELSALIEAARCPVILVSEPASL